jgi:hypothetical protein
VGGFRRSGESQGDKDKYMMAVYDIVVEEGTGPGH